MSDHNHVRFASGDANSAMNEPAGRITVPEIARRLRIGRLAVYKLLDSGVLPGLRIGRRWLVTHYAFDAWLRSCGSHLQTFTSRPDGANMESH